MELRYYQKDALKSIRTSIANGLKRIILCAPTGAGKTVMFSKLISEFLDDNQFELNRILILSNRVELLTQSNNTLNRFNISPFIVDSKLKSGVLKNKLDKNEDIVFVGMSQTIKSRLRSKKNDTQHIFKDFITSLNLLIIDEAHFQDHDFIQEHIDFNTLVIGVTATPIRTNKQSPLKDFYQIIIDDIKINNLIESEFLATPIHYSTSIDLTNVKTVKGDYDVNQVAELLEKNRTFDGVYENYMRLTPNKKAIIFSGNVESSKNLVSSLNLKGLSAKHIDASCSPKERKDILSWFKNTQNAMLSNVGILTTGFDEPSIEVVILYRATKSLSLYFQMCGRGSRTFDGKKNFFILDFGSNVIRHGFWDANKEWSLVHKEKALGAAPVRECPSCNAVVPIQEKECSFCGHIFPITEKEKKEAEIAKLKLMTKEELSKLIRLKDFKTLELIAEVKGYHKKWVVRQLRDEDLELFAQFKKYDSKWVTFQKKLRQKNN